MRISDWSSDVCSSDLELQQGRLAAARGPEQSRQLALGEVERNVIQRLGAAGIYLGDGLDFDDGARFVAGGLGRDGSHRTALFSGRNRVTSRRSRSSMNSTEKTMMEKIRSEEHTSDLQSLMRSSYAVFCLNKKK